jgi:hypothetical protein
MTTTCFIKALRDFLLVLEVLLCPVGIVMHYNIIVLFDQVKLSQQNIMLPNDSTTGLPTYLIKKIVLLIKIGRLKSKLTGALKMRSNSNQHLFHLLCSGVCTIK